MGVSCHVCQEFARVRPFQHLTVVEAPTYNVACNPVDRSRIVKGGHCDVIL